MNARTLKFVPFLAGLITLMAGCNKKDETTLPPPPIPSATTPSTPAMATTPSAEKSGTMASAEKTSFKEVTDKLDKGGSFFMYLSTEKALAGLAKNIAAISNLLVQAPTTPQEAKQGIVLGFQALGNFIADSGLQHISGLGASSIAREPGLYFNKVILHHNKGEGDGLIWTMFGKESHKLAELDLLPEDTALAAYSDMDVRALWKTIEDEVHKLKVPQVDAGLARIPAQFKDRMGISLDDFLGSLGGGYGVIFTLDDSTKDTIPIGATQLEIPDPGLALYCKVKNDLIFDRIDALIAANPMIAGMITKSSEGGVKSLSLSIPAQVPIRLHPTLARHGDYLFLASSDKILHDILDAQAGEARGYKATDEYKKLSQGISMSGNNYTVISEKFGQTVRDVVQNVIAAQGGNMGEQKKFVQDLISSQQVTFSFAVGMNTSDGWEAMANGNKSMSSVLLPAAIGATAVGASMLLPALARAKQKAQSISCINNLRQIETAKQLWANSNGKQSGDTPTEQDLKTVLGIGPGQPFLTCPQGGTYTIGTVGEKPTCSIPGHALKD